MHLLDNVSDFGSTALYRVLVSSTPPAMNDVVEGSEVIREGGRGELGRRGGRGASQPPAGNCSGNKGTGWCCEGVGDEEEEGEEEGNAHVSESGEEHQHIALIDGFNVVLGHFPKDGSRLDVVGFIGFNICTH